jgi:3-hydroxyisobutyrate dehydrogenase-like beta-hydroxyacid dehydrogenase
MLEGLGTVHHLGGFGAGSAAKLVANATLINTLAAVGESLSLGRRLGLADDAVFDLLALTPLAAQAGRRRESVLHDEWPVRFELGLAGKDANLVAEAAEEIGADLRVASAAGSWFHEAAAAGLSSADYSRVLAHIAATARGEGANLV